MNIAFLPHVPHSLTMGGAEVQLRKTKAGLEARGHTVESLDFLSISQLKEVDLVHLFGCDPGAFSTLAGYLSSYGVPYVSSSIYYPFGREVRRDKWRSWVGKTPERLRRKLLEGAHAVLPNSESEKNLICDMFRLDRDKVHVVPNGVNTDRGFYDPDLFRKEYLADLPANEPFILSVARVEKRKNSLRLIEAAILEKIPIVFVGLSKLQQGGYQAEFEAKAQAAKSYVKRVQALPYDSDVLWSAFSACHSHALVSTVETPGLASLEAGITNANLVFATCGPVNEYLDGVAIEVDPLSVESIRQGLRKSISNPRGFMNAEPHLRKNYSWDVVAQKTEEIYQKVSKR